jgi:UDP-N-acetylglucosamine 1-carboxyvinyltransferase
MPDESEDTFIIAGTGAGASAVAEFMLVYGHGWRSLKKGSIEVKPGLGLLPGVLLDQHFAERGRYPRLMHAVLDKLRDSGAKIQCQDSTIRICRNGRLKAVDITTLPYPGFPTDVQAQMMALMAVTPGISIITERIFESRFMHVSELARLGADIEIEGPSAIVKGGKPLSGAAKDSFMKRCEKDA